MITRRQVASNAMAVAMTSGLALDTPARAQMPLPVGLKTYASRGDLKAVTPAPGDACYLSEKGREGMFVFRAGKFSSYLSADERETVFVKADAIDGETGAWERIFDGAVRLTWAGAAGDGTADDTAAIVGAFSIADLVDRGVADVGTFRCTRPLRLPAVDIGGQITLDMSSVRNPDSAYVVIGRKEHERLTSVVSVPNSRSIILDDAFGVAVGDVLILATQSGGSWNLSRPNYRAGEIVEVSGKSDNVITTAAPLYDQSYGPNTIVFRFARNRPVSISGINVLSSGYEMAPSLRFQNLMNSSISNIIINGNSYANIQVSSCFRLSCDAIVSRAFQSRMSDDDYSFRIVDSQAVRCSHMDLVAPRHAFTVSATGAPWTIVSRDIIVSDSTICSIGDSTPALDVHGNTEGYKVTNCVIFGGIVVRGSGGLISGNRIVSTSETGSPVIYFTELKSLDFMIADNDISYSGAPSDVNRGIIFDIGGNQSKHAMGDCTTSPGALSIIGNKINVHLTGDTLASFARICNRGSVVDTDLILKSNYLNVTGGKCAPFEIVHVAGKPLRKIDECSNTFVNVGLSVIGNATSGNHPEVLLGGGTSHSGSNGPQIEVQWCDLLTISGQILHHAAVNSIFVDMHDNEKKQSQVIITSTILVDSLSGPLIQGAVLSSGLTVRNAARLIVNGCTLSAGRGNSNLLYSVENVGTFWLTAVSVSDKSNIREVAVDRKYSD